jgi:ribosomal protein S27AE
MKKLSPKSDDERLSCGRCGGPLYGKNAKVVHGIKMGHDCARKVTALVEMKVKDGYTLAPCANCGASFKRPVDGSLPSECLTVDCACCSHNMHCLLRERLSGGIVNSMF